MTKGEEQNMWARLVTLEKQVVQLSKLLPKTHSPKEGETGSSSIGEPPRDRYGAAVGRPDM